jgi:pimeloyl-ACP methyl ester carboxylesterase
MRLDVTGTPAPPLSPPEPTPVSCSVSLGDGQPAAWRVHGDLSLPAGPPPRTVQLLVPGLTYDRRYWRLPGIYDYARHMVRAGYAVLALDRIGTGQSSRPPAAEVTVDSNVAVLHQVVQALRGGIAGHSFERVVVVGHSFGAGLAIIEAACHRDVDAIVVSGMLHTTTPLYDKVIGFFHPAAEDEVLAPLAPPEGYPQWYMTQRPGARRQMLESAEEIDPEMSRHNERIKSTATIGEGQTLPQTYLPEHSRAVKVPVLLVVGERDALFSGEAVAFARDAASVHRFEQGFFSPEAHLETHVIPRAGHALNLHRSAPQWFAIAQAWVDRRVGTGTA